MPVGEPWHHSKIDEGVAEAATKAVETGVSGEVGIYEVEWQSEINSERPVEVVPDARLQSIDLGIGVGTALQCSIECNPLDLRRRLRGI